MSAREPRQGPAQDPAREPEPGAAPDPEPMAVREPEPGAAPEPARQQPAGTAGPAGPAGTAGSVPVRGPEERPVLDSGTAWRALRQRTPARIGWGTSGAAVPTRHLLEFQLDHAEARDAVHLPLDVEDLIAALGRTAAPGGAGGPEKPGVLRVRSTAEDRSAYLQRPDLGRRLLPEDAAALPRGEYDIAFVIADGLSARAVQQHAAGLLRAVLNGLSGWRAAPVVVATQARVALGDEIARCLGASMVAVLIGERPGLSAADSLGVYLTYAPAPGRTTDAQRNCLSNIRPPQGMDYPEAAATLTALMTEARRRGLTGVDLKDDFGALPG